MELEHSFTVPVTRDRAWDVLLDVERVAPCMPGATLDSVDGDEIKGRIKVKLGPITMTYAGTAQFTERDAAAGVVTLQASGKETRGAGTASATVRSQLHAEGDQTRVTVHTSLNVTGRPAQFGRGVMADVSGKLIGIFADNLASMLTADSTPAASPPAASPVPPGPIPDAAGPVGTSPATVAPASTGPSSTAPTSPAPPRAVAAEPRTASDDAIDLLDVAGLPVLKRAIPIAAGLLLAIVLVLRRRARRVK
jgi:carbon monoxide dehydrogenase subunit G